MIFETEYADNPVCPYCGHEMQNAWEIDFGPTGLEGSADVDCDSCGKIYHIEQTVSVYYTTSKLVKDDLPNRS